MIVAASSVLTAFFLLVVIFGLVLSYTRDDGEAAHPFTTLPSVAVSASSVLVVLLAPAAVLLALLLASGCLYPDAAYYGDIWRLFALVLAVALGLFVYELLFEGFLTGSLKHFGLPVFAAKIFEVQLTAALLLVVSGRIVRSVDVSPGATLAVGAASACLSYFLERSYGGAADNG